MLHQAWAWLCVGALFNSSEIGGLRDVPVGARWLDGGLQCKAEQVVVAVQPPAAPKGISHRAAPGTAGPVVLTAQESCTVHDCLQLDC